LQTSQIVLSEDSESNIDDTITDSEEDILEDMGYKTPKKFNEQKGYKFMFNRIARGILYDISSPLEARVI
jgi:hypothetical protein